VRTLIVVGAGATVAEAAPKRPTLSKTPPLDGTFFHLCELAGLNGRETVRTYMRSTYNLDVASGHHTMEQVFNYIYSDVTSGNPTENSLDAYWALVRMYTQAIRVTTNSLSGTSQSGVGALLRYVLRTEPEAALAFVTFNQDLVIERALQSTSDMKRYADTAWNLANCYHLRFSEVIHHDHRKSFTAEMLPIREAPSISVLKLHGSLNWMYSVRSASDAKNAIRNPSKAPFLYSNLLLPESLEYRERQRMTPLLPLIVPPIFEKTLRIGKILQPVWRAAEDRLTRAEKLIVFGYSFPDGDLPARSMFRRCFQRNRQLREVHVIDTDPLAGARIAALADAPCTHIYRSVEVYRESVKVTG
jgi:hypothetical protein